MAVLCDLLLFVGLCFAPQLTQTQLPQSFEDAIQETINIQQNITQVQKQQVRAC